MPINIVPIIKNNGQVKVCIDFQNLNLSTPKGDYLMPIANILVNATSSHGIFTFMDEYSRYN